MASVAEHPRLEVQSGHLLPVMRIAIAPEHDLVVSSDLTGGIRAWNLRQGRSKLLPATLPNQRGGHASLVLNSAADWVASVAFSDGRLKVQRLSTGADLTPKDAPPLHRLVLSSDGRKLAALTRDGTLLRFGPLDWSSMDSGAQCRLAPEEQPGDPYGNPDLVFSRDGSELVSVSGQGQLAWLNARTGCVRRRLDLGGGKSYSGLALDADAGLIALSDYRTVTVRRLNGTGKPRSFPASDGMRKLLLSTDGSALLTMTSDGTVRLHELRGGTTREWKFPEGATALALDASNTRVAVGLFSGELAINDLNTGSTKRMAGAVVLPAQLARAGDGELLVRTERSVSRLDPTRGLQRRLFEAHEGERLNMTADGQWVWRANLSGGGVASRTGSDAQVALTQAVQLHLWESVMAPDGKHIAVSFGSEVRLHDVSDGRFVALGQLPHPATQLDFSPDGRWLLAAGEAATLQLFDVAQSRNWSLAQSTGAASFAFSTDSSAVAIGGADGSIRYVELESQASLQLRAAGSGGRVTSLAFSPDGERLAAGRGGGGVEIFDMRGNAEGRTLSPINGDVVSLVFLDDALLAGAGASGEIRLWYGEAHLTSMFLTKENGWVTVAPDGRFDTTDLDRPGAVAWVMPDAPLRPLPPEIFMRDFFEPRLLPRLLACRRSESIRPGACRAAFAPVPDLAQLNRVQPEVRVASVRRGAAANEAIVTVEARAGRDETQPIGKRSSEAYDVHLLRNGQLVGRWPETSDWQPQLPAWRGATRATDGNTRAWVPHEFRVRVPVAAAASAVTFSTYAFNEDRVKSETVAAPPFPLAKATVKPKRRAYVITVGANNYDDPGRRLNFAVPDAQAMAWALRRLDGYEVVPVSLLSDGPANTWTATKSLLAAVLARLGGNPVPLSLPQIAHAAELLPATPDDLVVLTFSGHGHAQPDGSFYLVASDSGPVVAPDPDTGLPPQALRRLISSEELSAGLGPIDAGRILVIIDACHAAASLEQPGFKPGPMGDRGLGQLAYDKGLQVLAASQADNAAIESATVRHGLLTFALVREGLSQSPKGFRRADLDGNGKLTLTEWLRFGEQRTPLLYNEIRKGRLTAVYEGASTEFIGKDTVVSPAFRNMVIRQVQVPSLFDFKRGDADVLLP